MVVRGIPRLVGLPALADYGEGLQVQRERVQADSGGDQTRGRKSPLPGEAGSLHLVHSARWGRVCDMCAWGTQRRLGAQDAQAPSEVADLHEGGRWSVYHSHQQFRHSEPSLSVWGGWGHSPNPSFQAPANSQPHTGAFPRTVVSALL